MKKLTLLTLPVLLISIGAFAESDTKVLCESDGPEWNQDSAVSKATLKLNDAISSYPEPGVIQMYGNNQAVKGIRKDVSKLDISTTHAGTATIGGYSASVCVTVSYEWAKCQVVFAPNGDRHAECP